MILKTLYIIVFFKKLATNSWKIACTRFSADYVCRCWAELQSCIEPGQLDASGCSRGCWLVLNNMPKRAEEILGQIKCVRSSEQTLVSHDRAACTPDKRSDWSQQAQGLFLLRFLGLPVTQRWVKTKMQMESYKFKASYNAFEELAGQACFGGCSF